MVSISAEDVSADDLVRDQSTTHAEVNHFEVNLSKNLAYSTDHFNTIPQCKQNLVTTSLSQTKVSQFQALSNDKLVLNVINYLFSVSVHISYNL